MDPSSARIHKLSTNGVEREPSTPHTWLGTLINTLDESGENASVGIGGTGSEENRIRMPGDGEDRGPDRLLEVLGNPPVVFGLEVTDGDGAGAGTDGELGFVGRPTDGGGSAVEAEEDESVFPGALSSEVPDVGIAVLGAGDNLARLWGNVNGSNGLVVAGKLVLESEALAAGTLVELDLSIPGHGKELAVGGEAVVCNRGMEEEVDFRSRHDG